MTASEYEKLYRQARKTYPTLMRQAYKRLKNIYKKASAQVAEKVRSAELAGNSELTIASLQQIENQLEIAANNIRASLRNETINTARAGIEKTSKINVDYLNEIIVPLNTAKLTAQGIQNIFVGINNQVIESLVNRMYQDGYTFSERVWRIGTKYQNTIKDILTTGIAQGRGTIRVAKDIQVYTQGNVVSLANRYGPNMFRMNVDEFRRGKSGRIAWKQFELKYGEETTRKVRAFMKRIGNRVDSNALRLVRSELYSSLQDAAKLQGRDNPGCNGLYDWVMEAGRQHWKCDCEKYAGGGKHDGLYKYDEIPAYPHPNCRCDIRPQLRNKEQFESDLKTWVNGGQVDYIDNWYYGTYLA